jgi:hypothetical protein
MCVRMELGIDLFLNPVTDNIFRKAGLKLSASQNKRRINKLQRGPTGMHYLPLYKRNRVNSRLAWVLNMVCYFMGRM